MGFRSFAKPIAYVNIHNAHSSDEMKKVDVIKLFLGIFLALRILTRMFVNMLIMGELMEKLHLLGVYFHFQVFKFL